jgi:outer membrane protein assembly factor BamA
MRIALSKTTRLLCCALALLLWQASIWGQKTYTLRLNTADREHADIVKNLRGFSVRPGESGAASLALILPDSASLSRTCNDLLQYLRAQSYLSASLDSLQVGRNAATAWLHLGPDMHWVRLKPASMADHGWLEAAGFREKFFTGKPLRYDVFLNTERHLLEYAENNGFPFAMVRLDSIDVGTNGAVSAILTVDRKQFFTFKGLKVTGDIKLPPAFLPNYLGLQPGTPYSRAKVLKMRDQLRTLPFIDITGNPSVTFSGNEATVNLFLQKKKAGRFDFIIGLLPQPTSSGNNKLLLTGSLSAAFQNALSLGERLSVDLERLRPATQKLEAEAGIPYLLGTSFGAFGNIHIFKRDSAWVDAQGELGVEYLLAGGNTVRFFWENKSSSLQKIDTLSILESRRLPPNLDLRQNGFGIQTTLSKLDYRFNPRKGWLLNLKTVAGFSSVLRNNQIESLKLANDPNFSFSTLYDSVAGRATRFQIDLDAVCYLPLFIRSTLKLEVRSGGIFSSKPIFANEQYRLGGNKLLRGFNEESLFATRFAVATAEFRLLLSQNSYLSAFSDLGYLENATNLNRAFLRPLGLGVGMNFETKAGIFGISIAVGRQDSAQGIDFKAAKFHLGYVSLF